MSICHRFIFTALIFLTAFINLHADAPPTKLNLRYTGTDFEGRLMMRLEWDAVSNATYVVQRLNGLPPGESWIGFDTVKPTDTAGTYQFEVTATDQTGFYRLVLPQPQITGVEPAVVDVTVSNTPLYILGQCLPTNALVLINGLYFTPTIVNTGGVWAVVLLNSLPPGETWFGLSVVDAGTSNVIATLPNSVLGVDTNSPYLLEPPEAPPASPSAKENGYAVEKLTLNFEEWKMSGRVSGNGGGGGGGNHNTSLAANGNIAAALNGNVVIGEARRAPAAVPRAAGLQHSVFLATGEFSSQVTDLAVAGRGLDFIWARTYHSRIGRSGASANGWTFSYDVHIQPLGGDIVIHDGTGRADRFFLQTNGTYTCPGFFREGTLTGNVFRLTFADTGYWEFNPSDGTATAGKLAHVVDRNGNTLSLNYDGSGLLTQIVDDLDRTNTVAYDVAGRVTSVTDFSGRVVRYEYDGNGDLAACVSPAVTGTPNGNDFPGGKTNRYTYSSGYLDDRENHLLLSIIDANGQTTRQYVYQHNQTDFDFLRCISVQRGASKTERITVLPEVATPANHFAVVRCIVNDPEGNVGECFYDARNRCVMERDYTGRATPEAPVTDTLNRPTGKLRSSDPDYYETQWSWNNDSLCTRLVLDSHQIQCIYESDFDPATSARKRADCRVVRELATGGVDLDGDGVADVTDRSWHFDYDPRFGTTEDRYLLGLREYDPAKSYLAGDTTIYNGSIWQKVDNTDSVVDNMRTRINDLENRLKSLGILARTVNSGVNEPLPYATLHAAASGKRFGIGDTTPQGPLGWDGTIKAEVRQNIEELHADLFVDACADSKVITDRDTGRSKGFGFAVSATDPRGNVTTASYDAKGNSTQWEPHKSPGLDAPELEFTYNSHGELTAITNAADVNGRHRVDTFTYSQGQLVQCVEDAGAGGLNLTSSFEYDARGNLTRSVDPLGHDWLFTYNSLDQCVRCESPTNLTARCVTDFLYNAADNVQDAIVEVRDETDNLLGSMAVRAEYDPLHRLTQIARDVDATHAMTNRFVYDGNDGCVQVLGGDAVSGADPHQTMAYEYDERGLLFREIAAPGSPLAGTNEFSYTTTYNPATKQYVDDTTALKTDYTYDGFDRLASVEDPMGNQTTFNFDANDNLKVVRHFGQTNDVPGTNGNLRLAESRYEYDGLDRLVRSRDLFFSLPSQAPIGDGERTTTFAYAPNGQCMNVTDDLGHTTTFGYDTAGRSTSVSSPGGKTIVVVVRDAFGNATRSTRTDTPDLGGPAQVFSRTNIFDSLNRCVSTTDNVGNNENWSFDSLNRVAQSTDARGNHSFYEYDLIGRCTLAIGDLDGDGVPDLAHDISSSSVWSSSSGQLLAAIDSHGNTTSYAYDSLSRCTSVTNADGTRMSLVWSPRSNLIQETDANGTVVLHTYDLNDRCISNSITPGAGVASTTTFETFAYDGVSRLVAATNDVSHSDFEYDSLGSCRGNHTDGWQLLSACDSVGNRTSVTYPGGRALTYAYDVLNQCTNIVESSSSLASFSYAGPGRVARVSYGNGASADVTYDGLAGSPNASGDFGHGQISSVTHAAAGGSPKIVAVNLKWDHNGNKTLRTDTIFAPAIPRTNDLGLVYDAADRLTQATLLSGPALLRDTVYGLDRMGNRTNVTGAASCSGDYTLSSTVPPADYQMNQYTATACDNRTYDDNGNLLGRSSPTTGSVSYQYDYADRLVQVQSVDFSGGTAVITTSTYAYDALGRRISKSVSSGGLPPVTTQFLYDDGNVIEERENGAVTATFVLDGTRSHDDGVIQMQRGGQDYYFHTDDQGNVLALTDASGDVVERYDYDDYGAVTFLAADGTPLVDGGGLPVTSSPIGNVYCWGGLRLDAETGLHNDDSGGYLDTLNGRSLARAQDDLQRTGGTVQLFAGNNPWSGGSPNAMKKGTVKFFNETKGFGIVAGGGGGGGGGGGVFAIESRDILKTYFETGDVPTQDQRTLPRNILKSFFEKGDKPTQAQFGALIDSMVNRIDDRYLLGLRGGRVWPKGGYWSASEAATETVVFRPHRGEVR